MSVSNGNVTAPVGLYEVARLLNEKEDVGAVCTSDNINPYSLIQPAPASYPSFGVENMEEGWIHGESPGNSSLFYEPLLWGFWVPYVGQPASIIDIMNNAWVRNGANGYYCLNHFDGYQHNAKPSLPVFSHTVQTGRPIVVSFMIGGKPTEAVNLVNGKAKGNPGSVVTIGHVFKDKIVKGVRVGFSLYEGDILNAKNLRGTYISASPINFNSLQIPITAVTTDFNASSETDYYIVPWISDGQIGEANAKFYSLKYAPDYEPYIHVRTDFAGIAISWSLTEISEDYYYYKITFRNTWPTSLKMSNIRINVNPTNAGSFYPVTANQLGSVTIPSNSSEVLEGYFNFYLTPPATDAYVWITGDYNPTESKTETSESQGYWLKRSGPSKPREE